MHPTTQVQVLSRWRFLCRFL